MVEQTVHWLVREVSDLLDVSNVGLYEFMEIMAGAGTPQSGDDRKSVAWKALRQLLREDDVVMYRTRWPDAGNEGDVAFADLPSDPWNPPDAEGRYIAIDRR